MKRSGALFALVFFCLFIMPDTAFAQRGGTRSQGETIEIRFASPLPRNSDWGRVLDRVASECGRVTNNTVRLRVLHDGVEGSESKMLSSLSADNIQMGLFFSSGLAEICPAVMSLSVPFQIKTDEELELVLNDILPTLNAQVSRNNFAVIAWSRGGWVNIFSKEPVIVPDDLRRQKMATTSELRDMNLALRTMGFSLVDVDFVDIGIKLANNMVNATYLTPMAIAPLGLHKSLKNMLDLPIAPFMGAIVMNRVTWNKLGPERQQEVVNVTQRIANEFDTVMLKTVGNAVTAMNRDGLQVNRPNNAQEELWHTELGKAMPSLLGTTFDRELYQRINVILERARSVAATERR